MKLEEFLDNLEKVKKDIRLKNESRMESREKLVNFIELMPLAPRATRVRANFLPFIRPVSVVAGFLIIALAGGGISLVAEASVPGDALYSIKININEEVMGALAITAESKAEWEAERAERRLEEANKLALATPVKEDSKVTLEQKFEEHAGRVEERIEMIESKGNVRAAVDIATKFETSLRAHDEILEKIEERKALKAPLKDKVEKRLAQIEGKRMALEAKIIGETDTKEKVRIEVAAKGKINSAKGSINGTRNFVAAKKEKLSVGSLNEVESKLKEAEDSIARAKTEMSQGLYGEAFNLGNEALKTAEGTRKSIAAKIELGLNEGEPFVSATLVAPTSTASSTGTSTPTSSASTTNE